MKEKAKAHNAAHSERFDPPTDEPKHIKRTDTGTGWVKEEFEEPDRDEPR